MQTSEASSFRRTHMVLTPRSAFHDNGRAPSQPHIWWPLAASILGVQGTVRYYYWTRTTCMLCSLINSIATKRLARRAHIVRAYTKTSVVYLSLRKCLRSFSFLPYHYHVGLWWWASYCLAREIHQLNHGRLQAKTLTLQGLETSTYRFPMILSTFLPPIIWKRLLTSFRRCSHLVPAFWPPCIENGNIQNALARMLRGLVSHSTDFPDKVSPVELTGTHAAILFRYRMVQRYTVSNFADSWGVVRGPDLLDPEYNAGSGRCTNGRNRWMEPRRHQGWSPLRVCKAVVRGVYTIDRIEFRRDIAWYVPRTIKESAVHVRLASDEA